MDNIFDFGYDAYDKLDHDSKVNLITSILPGFIEQGFSANDSLSILKDNGLGIGRSEFLGLYRDVLGVEEQSNRIRYVSGDNIPSEALLGHLETPIDKAYRFIYKYTYIHAETGETVTDYTGINSNQLLSVNDMQANAADDINEKYPGKIGTLLSVRLWKGFKG